MWRSVFDQRGVVDQHIHATVGRDSGIEQGLHLRSHGDINRHGDGLATGSDDGFCDLFGGTVAIRDDHSSPFRSETHGDGAANSGCRTRDDRNFPIQTFIEHDQFLHVLR